MPKKILFIDSDEAFAQGLSKAAGARGHTALIATNSEQGVTLARQETPDLIVVCVEAQPTNGYMLCTRLKKDDRLKSIPVILTSANATPDSFEKHKKLKTRAEEYLIKPFEAPALFEKANALLGLPAEAPAHAEEEVVEMTDEPLGIGELVVGQDEPISIGDSDMVGAGGEEGFLVDEVEEVVQVDEQSATSEGDPDLQMFDRAFDALEMPGAKPQAVQRPAHREHHDHPDTAPIQALHHDAPTGGHDEVVHLTPEDAHEAKSPVATPPPPLEPERSSIDELLGPMDEAPIPAQDSSAPHAVFEARIAQLEQDLAQRTAELEASKAAAGSSADLLRLKEQRNRQDRELLRLKEELQSRDRELIELREEHTTLEHQVQSQKDESIKREAAAKALQQRADALAAAAKKFERELTAARRELEGVAALRAKAAEHEKERAELQRRLADAQSDMDRAAVRASEVQETHAAELQGAREMHATELAGARELHATEAQELRGDLEKLHAQAAKAREELEAARAQVESSRADAARLGGDLEAVRAELATATSEKDAIAEEREELRRSLADAQAAAAQNEERAVKAYQKIKGDERLRERTRKALTIALQLLDEAPALEPHGEPVETAKSA